MMQTIPHLVKECQFGITERVLVIDTAPLSDNYRNRPGIGTMEEFRLCCQQLLERNVVDKLLDIDYSEQYRKQVYKKHFGRDIKTTHDFRGYPILGSVFAIESAQTDYIVHFDSDMLLYQQAEHNWIQDGIDLMQQNPDIMFVSPLSGPPSGDGSLRQRGVDYQRHSSGHYSFTDFTSRKFLVNCKRLEEILPLQPLWISWKRRYLSYFTGKSAMWSWEVMISNRLKATDYVRVDLDSPKAWTLHTPDHGAKFIQSLPTVIDKVEKGDYPPVQAGDYDLQLGAWC
ncbi:hypothetical protein [Nostoc sp. NIES-3756]|uniref:hypothetical protein n=1 Tax=Nostoc sp. NIES-3756 TaxID=1751286 RepID=UPI001E4B1DCE|nr:hypothetical protein [Nostoc sp. NIES-3756]